MTVIATRAPVLSKKEWRLRLDLRLNGPRGSRNGETSGFLRLDGAGAIRELPGRVWADWPWPWEDAVTRAYRAGERYILEYD